MLLCSNFWITSLCAQRKGAGPTPLREKVDPLISCGSVHAIRPMCLVSWLSVVWTNRAHRKGVCLSSLPWHLFWSINRVWASIVFHPLALRPIVSPSLPTPFHSMPSYTPETSLCPSPRCCLTAPTYLGPFRVFKPINDPLQVWCAARNTLPNNLALS